MEDIGGNEAELLFFVPTVVAVFVETVLVAKLLAVALESGIFNPLCRVLRTVDIFSGVTPKGTRASFAALLASMC